MYHIHYLNKISPKGTALWKENYQLTDELGEADGVLVRSAAMHDMALPKKLLAVARAGAGVNNIPLDKCAEQGIVVFNTPGANARSVMELTLCGLLLGCRDVIGGINWVKSIADQGDVAKKVENKWIEVKSSFVPIQQGVDRLKAVTLDMCGKNIARVDFELKGLENSLRKHNPFTSLEEKGYQYVSVESQTDIIAVKDLRFENGKIETDLVKPYEKPEKNYAFGQTFQISDFNIWEWFKIGFYCIIGLFGLAALIIVLVKLLKKQFHLQLVFK